MGVDVKTLWETNAGAATLETRTKAAQRPWGCLRITCIQVKPGKEDTQAVGFLEDGAMVVVSGGRPHIGRRVQAEIISVLPTAGGKMIFARQVADLE